MEPADRLIVALDLPAFEEAADLATSLRGVIRRVKVGLELYCATGPTAVTRMRRLGLGVMLDLKLHDIPETVGRATAAVAGLGADLLTVHTAGGSAMMEAAVKAAAGSGTRVLGITVLTALDEADLAAVGVTDTLEKTVLRRAKLAREAGLDGVVASPREAEMLRRELGPDFLIVTPGVRPTGAATGDQKRVTTPADARAAGADMIVVGRPIRDAADARAVAMGIIGELS